jgi:UDP:flavonoid glycosyltransferase YjiC (YdhE family)
MRILFATTRAAGHFGPLVPFAHACRRAGHEVLVAGPRSCAPHVERAGLPLAAHEDPSEEVLQPIFDRARRAGIDEANRIVVEEIFAGEHARSALPGMLATMRAWRPHVVLRETSEFASPVAAQRLGVPHMQVAIFLAARAELERVDLGAPLDRLRAQAGLGPDPRPERLQAQPYLTLAPRSLEDPSDLPRPGTQRFHEPAGPSLQLPDWWGGREEPLVYVSFGSIAAGSGFYPAFYRAALDALAELPARVLLTLGMDVDPAELGSLPASVHVERWVPQQMVMPHAAAMVGHGGAGSTLMAMAAGVPQAVVPLFADQPHNARRVAALGAGIALEHSGQAGGSRLDAAMDRATALDEAVRTVLADARYREAASTVAAEIAALPSIDTVTDTLAQVAGGAALAA